ncbi:hypothetical protein FSARC_7615 [Fusarium sarcochroum]|uniref:Hydrophobin n=1 Tax=Fusarium sarcochroum TaxID=1208366 RepID=A0A8H4X817_9HYPO|nr:hypothetical protein FSARC_7615 [Fusarium sarcochroum]
MKYSLATVGLFVTLSSLVTASPAADAASQLQGRDPIICIGCVNTVGCLEKSLPEGCENVRFLGFTPQQRVSLGWWRCKIADKVLRLLMRVVVLKSFARLSERVFVDAAPIKRMEMLTCASDDENQSLDKRIGHSHLR